LSEVEPVATPKPTKKDKYKQARVEDNQRFIDAEFEQQQQQLERQDIDLEEVVESTGRTKVAAVMIGQELVESTTRLTEVDEKMDRVQGQLDSVLNRMKDFLKRGSTWMWAGCIILTIIVIILLIWVFMGK
jgi:macrodomain Ter protein organizer (MatP/YcbG family)